MKDDSTVIPIKILQTCAVVRRWMVAHYGEGVSLAGHCIEASELLVDILHMAGFPDAVTVEGWCRYDDERYCSTPYDAHTWVEVGDLYVDVTADQFNYGMDPEFQFCPVTVQQGLPHGIVREITEEETIDSMVHYMEITSEHAEDASKFLTELHQFHVDLEPERYRPADRPITMKPEWFGIIAYEGEKPVGLASGFLVESLRTTQVALLEDLYVVEGYRWQGVGTELLRRFETLSRVKGATTMRLGVVEKNVEAVEFYKHHGYAVVEYRMERSI